ncbi:Uncharacterised protein [Serratia liquefaciens]|uniref:hypothetical protein n=2 Tax=Serratia liquefaciens TaxID=614 RepID=UPI00217BE56D|nr:hypothetical protein [Serratia liquefaciens]CAI1219747.1 Uncharacterised protein [Serratia liquefaciens]
MLFRLTDNTPRFEIFRLLNAELLHFLEHAVNANTFNRALFTNGAVGQACWDNARENDARAKNDLTRDKFEKLFTALNDSGEATKRQLYEVMYHQQDMRVFFDNPIRELLTFLPELCLNNLKQVATHLYCATKDLAPVVGASHGTDITVHFNAFRAQEVNGNICKACGMKELAAFRAEVADGDQWRADYDHQLCKSKYPIFAVHPDNLIPLCDICNQDAKKAKDLFQHSDGRNRLAFYPYNEEANGFINIEIHHLRDPEPTIKVKWNTQDATLLDKLNTWDEVYEIRSRVEGKFRSLEAIIEDEINPRDSSHLVSRINDEAQPKNANTLKRKEWSFWYQKLFSALEKIDIEPFVAKWDFVQQQAADGGEFILN